MHGTPTHGTRNGWNIPRSLYVVPAAAAAAAAALQVMDRKEDIEQALDLLKEHVTFDKDVKVWGEEGSREAGDVRGTHGRYGGRGCRGDHGRKGGHRTGAGIVEGACNV